MPWFSRNTLQTLNVLFRALRASRSSFSTLQRGYRHFRTNRRVPTRKELYAVGGVIGTGFLLWLSRRETVPYTHRRHTILVSDEQERQYGKAIFEQVRNNAIKNRALLPDSHRFVKLVKSIGTRIAEVAGDSYGEGTSRHMTGLQWEFLVVQSNDVNAFVVPGGKVVVFSGLIQSMGNVDELAAVLAHEVAHIVARHSAERITEIGILSAARFLLAVLFGLPLPVGIANLIFTLPHSRRAETEADVIGVRLMAKACFNPTAAASMLGRLGRFERSVGGEQSPSFLRTHPITSNRIERVQQEMSDAMVLFDEEGCRSKRRFLTSSLAPHPF